MAGGGIIENVVSAGATPATRLVPWKAHLPGALPSLPNALRMLPVVGQVEAEPIAGRALLTPRKEEHPRQVRLAHAVQDLHQRRAHRVQVGPHRLPRLVAPGLVLRPVLPRLTYVLPFTLTDCPPPQPSCKLAPR